MKIVVVSDSHRRSGYLTEIKAANRNADFFIHCGDFETDKQQLAGFLSVQGNNDIWSDAPMERTLEIDGLKFLVTHSHQYYGFYRIDQLHKVAVARGFDVVLFGHTHTPYIEKREGIWLINPGSLFYNRDGSKIGYMVITTAYKEIVDVQRITI